MRAVLLVRATDRALPRAAAGAPPDLILLDPADAGRDDLSAPIAEARSALPGVPVFARLHPLTAGGLDEVAGVTAARPDGIWLRDATGRRQVEQLAARLAVSEAELGLADGTTRIVASVESAAGALAVASLAEAGPRLAAISLDLAPLAGEIGCTLTVGGRLPAPLEAVRATVVLAAAAARVPGIDSPAAGSPDLDTFAAEANGARRDGFSAKLARDLDQLAVLRRLAGQAPLGRWMENFVSGVATK